VRERQDRLDFGWGSKVVFPKNFESRGSYPNMNIQYTNLKFAFEAAKNIRSSHSNLFWGASLAPILPSVPLPQHVSDLRKIGGCDENRRV
jgi:hypothetical protein